MPASRSPGPGRRAPVLLILLLLAACGLPQPFRHTAYAPDGNPLVTLRTGSGVTIPPVWGAPLPMDRMIALDVAEALREQAEIPAVATVDPVPAGAGLRLTGDLREVWFDEAWVALTLAWRLTDAQGTVLDARVQTLGVPALDWLRQDPGVSRRIASDGGRALALLVQGDGGPPSSPATVALSEPDVPSMPPEATAVASRPETDGPSPAMSGSAEAAPAPPPTSSPAAPPSADGPRPIVMAPPEVTQAPGDGRRSLAEALTRLLKLNDVWIRDEPTPGRFHVRGTVEVLPAEDPSVERVSLLWRVLTEDGEELGRLTQENAIPAGLLDGAWGDTAYAVAEAALMGVGEILVRKGGVASPGGR
ncbi:hypothetical protein [Roseospira visakhapatnamensis]|uniref:Uncharacterized protein n=1 Tax=Roseospira visakhapatnamensis TaxID=390880 RepID=A0A7W6WAQ9_9PROT|nr:hypothetical protein [Roseospira visakhapatnamensis]MBB4267093.1 hypothetical protein [Roseospira visakhapatnamensis]